MAAERMLIYRYDGSFAGLLCCVATSYEQRELPLDILPLGQTQANLFEAVSVKLDPAQALRVQSSIIANLGAPVLRFIKYAFLTCLPQRELEILNFLRLAYRHGSKVMRMLTEPTVHRLVTAVRHLEQESSLFRGFVRFSLINATLIAEIEPKNRVLPLLTRHFCERYPEERFLIYDRTYNLGLVYQPYQAEIIPLTTLNLAVPDDDELRWRELWRLFYQTIEVPGRHNPRCQMSHMPKRYWRHLTELMPIAGAPTKSDRMPAKQLQLVPLQQIDNKR